MGTGKGGGPGLGTSWIKPQQDCCVCVTIPHFNSQADCPSSLGGCCQGSDRSQFWMEPGGITRARRRGEPGAPGRWAPVRTAPAVGAWRALSRALSRALPTEALSAAVPQTVAPPRAAPLTSCPLHWLPPFPTGCPHFRPCRLQPCLSPSPLPRPAPRHRLGPHLTAVLLCGLCSPSPRPARKA